MLDLVSVIVPVYNVKKYLKRCVSSLMSQTYANLEIILIDDGSTDGSGAICDDLANCDGRIKVIHQVNQGLSAARNAGIDASCGTYLCFVDSDDYVNSDYVKYLYEICVKNNCDIGICYHRVTDEDNYEGIIDWNRPVEVYTREEIFDMFYSHDWHSSFVIAWNKIYKRDVIGNIRYEVGIIHEDEATTFKYLYNAKKIAFGKEVAYYYYNRPESITGLAYSKKNLDILKAYENRLQFYKEHGHERWYDRECQYYLSEILNQYDKVERYLGADREILDFLRVKYNLLYKQSNRKNWSASRRIMYAIFSVFPSMYGKIKRWDNC